MTTKRPPYYHTDGSNCWTLNCSKGNQKSLPVIPLSEKVKENLDNTRKAINSLQKLALKQILHTGDQVNQMRTFVTRVKGGYNESEFKPPYLPTHSIFWTKPQGGLWLSPLDEETGVSDWDSLLGIEQNEATEPNNTVKFKQTAKILVIKSLNDYKSILDNYPLYPKYDNDPVMHLNEGEPLPSFLTGLSTMALKADRTPKRTMDISKLSQEYDAIYVTETGLDACGRGFYRTNHMPNDVNLSCWDIESIFVFNKNAIIVT